MQHFIRQCCYVLGVRPQTLHVVLALVFVLACGAGVYWRWYVVQVQARTLPASLEQVRSQLKGLQQRQALTPVDVFQGYLPSRSVRDDVVRDIARFANNANVQVQALSVESRDASKHELGLLRFQLVAVSDYPAAKSWLAELQARYVALAVQNLSIQRREGDGLKQDVRLSLVLWVKD